MFIEFIAAHLGLLYELSGVILILVAVIAVSGALISRFDCLFTVQHTGEHRQIAIQYHLCTTNQQNCSRWSQLE